MNLNIGMLKCFTDLNTEGRGRFETLVDVVDSNSDLDIILAPEWYFLHDKNLLYSRLEFEKLKMRIQEKTKGRDQLLVPGTVSWIDGRNYRNTALVVSNGETVLEYSKKREAGDDDLINRYFHLRKRRLYFGVGQKKGIFNWRGLRVGLEICYDHSCKALKNDVSVGDLDLQILVSCGQTFKKDNMVIKEGGLGLSCDGYGVFCKTYRNVGRKLVEEKKSGMENLDPQISLVRFDVEL